MSYTPYFSTDYTAARMRFCSGARALGCQIEEYGIEQQGPDGEELRISVAIIGEVQPKKVVVISSGLHGVEGFFGSAVQSALLEQSRRSWELPQETSLVLLHALNPYGFAWLRRCNENNIDLNRNFLLPDEKYKGSHPIYRDLNAILNPTSPPPVFEPFLLKALIPLWRYGMSNLKNALPVGQYDFPKGLFFGGNGPAKTLQILENNLPRWIGNAHDIIHIDFHTGLGRKGTYTLLSYKPTDRKRVQLLEEKFVTKLVEVAASDSNEIAYNSRGTLGSWCKAKFPQQNYDFLTAEFGTYNMLSVLAALRAENRAYWWGQLNDRSFKRAKQRMKEVFIPSDRQWREMVVAQGLKIVAQAINL